MCFSLMYRNSSFLSWTHFICTFTVRINPYLWIYTTQHLWQNLQLESSLFSAKIFTNSYVFLHCWSYIFFLKIVFICLCFFMTVELHTELEYYILPALQIYLQSHFHFLMDSSQCLGTKSLSLLTSLWPFFILYLLSQFYSLVALFC